MNSTPPPAQNPGLSVIFDFQSNSVRTHIDESGDSWFCAADVCAVLGYRNDSDAIKKHCRPKGVAKRDTLTLGGTQEITYIDEGNLYRLIIKSRKPEARPFESWVCDEVLPALRKKGKYELNAKVRQAKIEWQQARAEGRHIRRVETDAIKDFVEYARAQGSKNADRYYVNISRMENRALFFLEAGLEKPNNLRETLDLFQIQSLAVADRLVVKALKEGMAEGIHYKEIFQRAKEKVVALSLVVGPSSLAQIPMREGAI